MGQAYIGYDGADERFYQEQVGPGRHCSPRHRIPFTGARAKAWCLLAEASLSRQPGRKPGASLYTRKRLSLSLAAV